MDACQFPIPPLAEEGEGEEETTPMSGSVSGSDSPNPGAEMLLQLIAGTAQLHVLLSECTEEELGLMRKRLLTFKRLVRRLPRTARQQSKRKLGFR